MNWLVRCAVGLGSLLLVATAADAGITVNTPPVAFDAFYEIPINGQVNDLLNALDLDGDPLTFDIADAPDHGFLILNVASGFFSYVPSLDFVGSDSFGFTASDNPESLSNLATITIDIGLTTPVAAPASLIMVGAGVLAGFLALRRRAA